MQRLLNEIAEFARQSESRAAFRRETAARLRCAIGFDGVAWGPIPPGLPGTALEYYGENVPAQAIVAIAEDPQARLDIARAQRFLDAQEVAVDGGFSVSEKRRSSFFAGFLAPLRVGTYLSTVLGAGGRWPPALRLTREHGAFGDREVQRLRGLRPLLRLCEAFLDERRGVPRPPVPLTPRQLAIADLVCRGFTNAEIARAFGISPNTVRNRLADAYQRLSVTTRAEFVGIVLGLQR